MFPTPKRFVPCLVFPTLLIMIASAQPPVRPENVGERELVITPLEGSGTFFDPKRPAFLPPGRAGLPEGILSIRTVESDDGRFALVEVVARDRRSLDAVLAGVAGRPDVRRFHRGASTKAEVEREFRGKKRGFDLDSFVIPGLDRARAARENTGVR